MADINRIKGNVQRMIDGGASDSEIDAYLSDESVTSEMLRAEQPDIPQPEVTEGPGTIDLSSTGTLWPVRYDKDDKASFDSDVGILGSIKRGLSLPGDVMTGKVDLEGPEATGRLLEAATMMSPLGAASRAGGAVMLPTPAAKPKIPTQAELKAAASAGYQQAEGLGAEYSSQSIKNWALQTIDELNGKSQIAENYPEVHKLLNKLADPPKDSTIRLGVIGELYKELGRQAGSIDTAKAAAASTVQRSLDDFHQGLTQADMVAGSGTPAAASAIVKEARGNAAAGFRSDTITGLEKTVKRKTHASGSGRNSDNQTRSRLVSLLESRKGSRGLNEAEVRAIDDVIEGKPTKNALRYFGNLFGGGGGIMSLLSVAAAGGAGGAAMGAPGIAMGLIPPAIGAAARGAAGKMTKKEVTKLGEYFRSRSPLAEARQAPPMQLPPAPAPAGSPLLPAPQGTAMTSWPQVSSPVVQGAILEMQNERTPYAKRPPYLLNPGRI